jgi:hypothetical protein
MSDRQISDRQISDRQISDRQISDIPIKKRKKRCPNGTKRNKKGICSPLKKNISSKKKCSPEKPLYNPKTNRCVKNTRLNRIKLGLQEPKFRRKTIKKIKIVSPSTKSKTPTKINVTFNDCNSVPIYNNFNLNDFYAIGPLLTGIYYYPENNIAIYDKMLKKQVILTETSYISRGTYGVVYKIFDVTQKYILALKQMNYYDEEFDIIEELNKNNIDCNLLNSKIIKVSDSKRVVITNLYNNSLHNLCKKLSIHNNLQIIKKLAQDFLCLYNGGFVYTDIKPANILYKCLKNSKIKVTIGDIGSICKKNSHHIATYPPWDERTKDPTEITCNESSMVWGLGILFLQLNSSSRLDKLIDSIFSWANIKNVSEQRASKSITKINNTLKFNKKLLKPNYYVSDLVNDMLNFDIKKRITLQTLINRLS